MIKYVLALNTVKIKLTFCSHSTKYLRFLLFKLLPPKCLWRKYAISKLALLPFLIGCIVQFLESYWLRVYLCLQRKYKFLVTSLYHIYVKPSKNRLNFIKLKMGRLPRKEFIPACEPHQGTEYYL